MNDAPLKFLRRAQAAERVGLSVSRLQRMAKAGLFPPMVKIGLRSVAWVEGDVDQWMRDRVKEARHPGRRAEQSQQAREKDGRWAERA